VSTHFRAEVKNFMGRAINRAGFFGLTLKTTDEGLEIIMWLYPTTVSFHDLSKVEGRGKRSIIFRFFILRVTLKGPEDPAFEQMIFLLSTTFRSARIHGKSPSDSMPSEDLSMCAQLLRSSTIGDLALRSPIIDDISAPSIIAIASRADNLRIYWIQEVKLTDASAFIAQLDSLGASYVRLEDLSSRTSFFGLPSS
ncbi:hypothetical protein PMAYCL1PPCAC_28041, partial [Pristionchus mayeri]